MPDLGTVLMSTVVFLFSADGQRVLGSGFIVGIPLPGDPKSFVPAVVTAKHVVAENESVLVRFSRHKGNPPGTRVYDLKKLEKEGDLWVHSDEGVDIVVFRTSHFEELDYSPVPLEVIGSKELFKQEDLKASDRVLFPSLLMNFMGQTRNQPVLRDGSIALIPEEDVPIKFRVGGRTIDTRQPVILLNATSIPGASGAPVFLWPGPRLKNGTFAIGGTKPLLIGVMHGFYVAPREVVEVEATDVKRVFQENSGIAIIFPAWRLREILSSEVVSKRLQVLAARAK